MSNAGEGRWTIQLGSFEERSNALRLARKWKSRGYAAYITSIGTGARARHRVRVGAYPDRVAALAAAAKFRASGERASVVPPGH
ncbi:MAG TPA: SPOR domain-containing protein [Steroidobacteraceae bacterium]|nr:SPOR domain-containing protein [Steroidobacteraceae bacterium]